MKCVFSSAFNIAENDKPFTGIESLLQLVDILM